MTPSLLGLVGAWIVLLPVLFLVQLFPLYLREHRPEHYKGLWQVLGQSSRTLRQGIVSSLLVWLAVLPCVMGMAWLLPHVPHEVKEISLAVLPLVLLVIILVLLIKLRLAEMKHRQ